MASPLLKPILGRIPLIGPLLKSNSRLEMFTPEERKKLDEEYRNALGLGDKATLGAEAFDAFDTGSFRDIKKFEKTQCPDGKTIQEKLYPESPDPAHKKRVAYIEQSMSAILEPTPEFEKAQQDYKDAMTAFNELKKQVPHPLRAEALIGLMAEIQDEGIKAIEEQHKKEQDKLEELFTDDANLREDLKGSLGLSDDADIDTVKDNLMKDLKESQAKQLEEFKKSTSEAMTKLHQAAAAQNSELLFIANLHKNNQAMRDEINRIAEEKRQQGLLPPQPTSAVIGIKPDHMTLSGISVSDLKVIKSLTGKEITQTEDGTFRVEFSNSIMDFFYNQSPYQNILTDMTLMASAVKAAGYNTATFDIDVQPQEEAMRRARMAYHGAIKAGFAKQEVPKSDKDGAEPDHIVIRVNGKEMRVDELFKDNQAELQSIHQEADKIQAELKANEFKVRDSDPVDTRKARAEMESLREQYREQRRLEAEAEEEEDDTLGTSLSSSSI